MSERSKIVIIVASVRDGRKSDRVATYFSNLLHTRKAEAELLDLKKLDFPLFKERLKNLKEPPQSAIAFAQSIESADGVMIVTPEYNGGYPASLKNVIDLLYAEWKRKPVAICTVSSGPFAGSQVITSLLFTLWKIGAWVVPAMCPVPKVEDTFTEEGKITDSHIEKRTSAFVDELLLTINASRAIR